MRCRNARIWLCVRLPILGRVTSTVTVGATSGPTEIPIEGDVGAAPPSWRLKRWLKRVPAPEGLPASGFPLAAAQATRRGRRRMARGIAHGKINTRCRTSGSLYPVVSMSASGTTPCGRGSPRRRQQVSMACTFFNQVPLQQAGLLRARVLRHAHDAARVSVGRCGWLHAPVQMPLTRCNRCLGCALDVD